MSETQKKRTTGFYWVRDADGCLDVGYYVSKIGWNFACDDNTYAEGSKRVKEIVSEILPPTGAEEIGEQRMGMGIIKCSLGPSCGWSGNEREIKDVDITMNCPKCGNVLFYRKRTEAIKHGDFDGWGRKLPDGRIKCKACKLILPEKAMVEEVWKSCPNCHALLITYTDGEPRLQWGKVHG